MRELVDPRGAMPDIVLAADRARSSARRPVVTSGDGDGEDRLSRRDQVVARMELAHRRRRHRRAVLRPA